MIPPPEFRLSVGVYLSEEQLAELGEILRDFGFPNAPITPIIGGPGGWTAIKIVVLGPMAAFFIALASEAGKDAYHGLKALLARLWAIEDREEDDLTISDEADNLLVSAEPRGGLSLKLRSTPESMATPCSVKT